MAALPRLEIRDPVHGATVTTRRYTFSGVADPKCTVTVEGKYHATVEADGTWTLGLILAPGRNSTTFVATDPETGLETKQAIRVRYEPPLELSQWAGIGTVGCGTPYEDAIAALSQMLGAPDRASVSEQPTDPPASDEVQWAWAGGGMTVTFSDWSMCTMDFDGFEEFYQLVGWAVWGDTAGLSIGGVRPGSTVADLMVLEDDRDRCEQSRREDRSEEQGCITIAETPNDDGTYDFFRSQGLMRPNLYGTVDRNDPTGLIVTLASQSP